MYGGNNLFWNPSKASGRMAKITYEYILHYTPGEIQVT